MEVHRDISLFCNEHQSILILETKKDDKFLCAAPYLIFIHYGDNLIDGYAKYSDITNKKRHSKFIV